jgi:hypothetical protein
MRVLAATAAALILGGWAIVSADGRGSSDHFFKGEGHWLRHSLKSMRGGHKRGNSGPIDTLATWSSSFSATGVDATGAPKSIWPFTMVGQSPIRQRDDRHGDGDDRGGRTTWIPAPIVPINLELHEPDGSVLLVDANPVVGDVLKSPVFSPTQFSSSRRPTQYADAIQRAQFFSVADDDWHTMLLPRVMRARTIVLTQSADPSAPTYIAQPNDDGSCCLAVQVDKDAFLNALVPQTPTDTSTVMGALENAGRITTRDLSIFVLNNVFFISNSDPSFFGTGFHNYDSEPGSAANGWRERRYVMAVSSWITGGVLGTEEFADISALSHEIVEAIGDPFVTNETPWWLSPANFACGNLLEGADVIETAAVGETFPMPMPNGRTYHPVNVALLPWFAGMSPSPAIDNAYSYPNIGVLTSPNISQTPQCGF